MKETIFNFHDVILLLTFMSCILLAIFQAFIPSKRKIQTALLTSVFINQAFLTIFTLLYWSLPLKQLHLTNQSFVTIMLNFSYITEGPLLYLYLCSLLNKDFKAGSDMTPHLIVIVIYTLSASLVFVFLPEISNLTQHNSNNNFFFAVLHWLHINITLGLRLITICYGISCIQLLLKYSILMKERVSNYHNTNPVYLMILCIGFLVSWGWSLTSHILAVYFEISMGDAIGIANNYLCFVLIQTLFVTSIMNAHKIMAADLKPVHEPLETPITAEAIAKVNEGIEKMALHLETNINLDAFSSKIRMGMRETSHIINKHFQTNFFEFINHHRVEAAKKMLRDKTQAHKSITEIMLDSGFNSKTAFNRFFKRFEGTTPSEFRKNNTISNEP